MHGASSTEVAHKEVIKERWMLKERSEGDKARIVMKHFNTWKEENHDFYAETLQCRSIWFWLWQQNAWHWASQVTDSCVSAELKDEVYINMYADTLRLIREENLPNLQTFDDEGFYKVDEALYGYRGSPRFRNDAVSEAAKDLGLKPNKIDDSLHIDPGNFIQDVYVDGDLLSGDDQLVRNMVRTLKQKFLVKKVNYLAKVGDTIEILGRELQRTELEYRLITSSRYIDQTLKDMAMEKWNPVSMPGLQVTS